VRGLPQLCKSVCSYWGGVGRYASESCLPVCDTVDPSIDLVSGKWLEGDDLSDWLLLSEPELVERE